MNLVKAVISQDVPAQTLCMGQYREYKIGTTLPIDMQDGDIVALDTDSGTSYALYRPGQGVIWRYEPPSNEFTMSGKLTPEGSELLARVFGIGA